MNLNAPESGIASTLASRGRRGDSMLVHMAPEEVKGLQALALAHGGSLTINPETGLYEANILKKLLPTIIGAVMPSIPGLGTLAKTVGFGNATLGTGLLVGGATALIEGDLKKGLEAGLGAYSGANITQSLRAASAAANTAASQAPAIGAEELKKLQELPQVAKQVGATTSAPQLATSKIKELTDPLAGKTLPGLSVNPLAEVATNKLPALQQPSVMGGIKSLFTSPESRTAFGEAMGGGFKSPLMQNVSRAATYTGLMNAMTPEPKPLPTGGAMGEDYVYIPGGFNPQYGTGRDQPYQLPGKYYKRTPKGLVPFDPFALAPGVRGFADGGEVTDPNVAATRAYIEDLNRRAKNPEVFAYPGGQGLGGTNEPYVPGPSTGGGGGGGGGGAGSVVGGIIANDLINRGIGKGVDVIKDKLATDERAEIGNRPVEVTRIPAAIGAASGVASLVPPPAPAGTVDIGIIDESGNVTYETPGQSAPTTAPSVSPAAIAGAAAAAPTVASGISSLLPSAGGVAADGAGVVVNSSRLTDAAKAAYDAAYKAALPGGQAAAEAAGEAAIKNANTPWLSKTGFDLSAPTSAVGYAAAALGAYNTAKAIESGKEGKAALNAALTAAQFGGPLVALSAAAIAAIGASLVNTKEYGDKALENYWKAVDQGRGFGKAPPEELAQGFINFFRTNKNEFPGQAKYGRTGNEDFVYDMTQVINNAVKEGKVDKGADASAIYEKVVQPWLSEMGPGPKNEDARKIQDFMMTDMVYNFMRGAPISNAQVKGDKKFKIVSEKPTYAGTPPSDMQMQGQMPAGFQGRPDAFRGIGRDEFRTPFSEPEERESIMPTPFSEPQAAAPPPPTPFSEPEPTPYMPRIIDEEPAPPAPPPQPKTAPRLIEETNPAPYMPSIREEELVGVGTRVPIDTARDKDLMPYTPPPTPFSEPEREYIPTPFSEAELMEEEEPRPRKRTPRSGKAFNYGGAVGEDYNFGFAGGGMPGEYQAGGKLLDGPGDGMSDDIPAVIRGKGVQRAALADGEFVIPADVVSHLGNGSTKAGAKKLYDMMARVRKARTGKTSQAPAVKTNRLLPV